MFRKTVREYKRKIDSWSGKKPKNSIAPPTELIHRETYWFLFIPIYTTDFIKSSNR